MNIVVSTKLCHLSKDDRKYINKKVQKLSQALPWKGYDLPRLSLVMRKHKTHSFDHEEKRRDLTFTPNPIVNHENVDRPEYYDGTIKFEIPGKNLIVNMLGVTCHEALKDGFDELLLEVTKYKNKHFSSDSDFANRNSIRRNS